MAKRDYYEILGIDKSASPEEISRQYKILSKKYHPDISDDPDAENKFNEIREANEVLKDPEKREMYNRFGHSGIDNNGAQNFSGFEDIFSNKGFGDIFSNIFGNTGFQQTRSTGPVEQKFKGQDITARTTITLKDLLHGTKIILKMPLLKPCNSCHGLGAASKNDIKHCKTCSGSGRILVQHRSIIGLVQTQQTCSDCHGRGKIIIKQCSQCSGKKVIREKTNITVTLPHSYHLKAEHHDELILRGKGHCGLNGGPNGDIYLEINIKPNEYYYRQDNDLHLKLDISYLDAILGREILVPTFDENIKIKVPAGIQNNETFAVPKFGFFINKFSSRRGNLIIHVQIATPKRINHEIKKLLKTIAENDKFKVDNSKINRL